MEFVAGGGVGGGAADIAGEGVQFGEVADQGPAGTGGDVVAVGGVELGPVVVGLVEVVGDGEGEVEFAGAVAGAVPVDEQPPPVVVLEQVVGLGVGVDDAASEWGRGRVLGALEPCGMGEEPLPGAGGQHRVVPHDVQIQGFVQPCQWLVLR